MMQGLRKVAAAVYKKHHNYYIIEFLLLKLRIRIINNDTSHYLPIKKY